MRATYLQISIISWVSWAPSRYFLAYSLDPEQKGNNVSSISPTKPRSSKSWNHAQKDAFISAQHSGPIDDASCNVEQIEYANDSQLYSILHELKNTEFFRNYAVDLDTLCPLHTWGEKKYVHTQKPEESFYSIDPSKKKGAELDELDSSTSTCSSDPNTEPVCKVQTLGENEYKPTLEVKSQDDNSSKNFLKPIALNKEEDSATCSGGAIADELDEESPPLCQLNTGLSPFQQPLTSFPGRDMLSSALNNINKGQSWESELQKQTFDWSRISDPIVTSPVNPEPCDDDDSVEGKLPDSFWLDMCSSISSGNGLKMVNLALNPERNTGYNGTHIWRAIYEENCIVVDGVKDQPMCYEERVLYRLFSGLHASTTLSIAMNYYPPNKRKGRDGYEPNPSFFMEKFSEHPDYIRNLHFSYVVLLRALKKAAPYLYTYKVHTGNIVEDETATILLRRLLDSSILSSCNHVFTAFDETLMFQKDPDSKLISKQQELVSLQKTFKGVFHNVSSILDCVQCQQCKLHGKLAMLGYGTALKILFLSRQDMIASSLSRNEIVALINTIAKLSEALKYVRELTSLYWMNPAVIEKKEYETLDHHAQPLLVDAAIGAIAKLAQLEKISPEREEELITLALRHDSDLLILAKYYAMDIGKFSTLSKVIGSLGYENLSSNEDPDAIVVGTGLAGLTAALNILDRGGKVVIVEKEHRMGGNSNKASSGINACCLGNNTGNDNLQSFLVDTTKSAGSSAKPELIRTLIENSASAVEWLKGRVGVDLSLVAQLGGHQHERTHRPQSGMVGAEIIYGMQKAVKAYEQQGKVKMLVDTQVKQLLITDAGVVNGVEVKYLGAHDDDKKRPYKLTSPNVILATGGFASDRSSQSYLAKYRPELIKMPATAGPFSTGDGIGLATNVGANLIDMEKIQIHPTGWVDPADPTNPNKILAAELMRGVGGILLDGHGKRFCNELGTRAYVTEMMLSHDSYYNYSKVWDASRDIPTFSLVLTSSAAKDGEKHVDHYMHKGLLRKIVGVSELSRWMGVSCSDLRSTLSQYIEAASKGIDEWGKESFRGLPNTNLDNETFYAGTVVPVLHYCMGGLTIDVAGRVLDRNNKIIPGLYAAGEVTGGVHGDNRLGGNSLLECTVFGTIIGKSITIMSRESDSLEKSKTMGVTPETVAKTLKAFSVSDLTYHNRPDDCWIAIHGFVYDLTDFAEEHPGGIESIHRLCGKDGTEEFDSIHSRSIMDDFEEAKVGTFL